jgi:asparagine synthase (glutamine-hydrolysing)
MYDVEIGSLHTWRYWSPPNISPPRARLESEALVDELASLLQDAVHLRLAADVPVGILLSGGIDSSLVTAMASECSSKPVKTFTITFPGHRSYNEGPYARRVAEHFGTDHHELEAEPATVDLLPTLAQYYDEPLGDSSLVATYLVSRLTREHVTVALAGDGGDELFAGYQHYMMGLRNQRLLKIAPQFLRAIVAASARCWLPVGFKGRNFLSSLSGGLREHMISTSLLFDATARRALLAAPVRQALHSHLSQPESYKLNLWNTDAEPVDQMTHLDFMTYLPDDILLKVDRASMAVSLEVRAPWLDQNIIAFAFGRLPGSFKASVNEQKILPRRLARRLLPPDLDLNRKQGFSLPLEIWLRGQWGTFVADILSEADTNLFNPDTLARLIQCQLLGFSNTSRLFALTMFELWRREYKVSLP